ncbi:MAG: DUF5007 domain-containing protein [Bacteroidota bacterium]|nr:DUF5007 domain-containing protein [Bacteroidota bacterium]MDP4204461.1 DUF5007 domain-containing protein [Bacteroidota bacterium]
MRKNTVKSIIYALILMTLAGCSAVQDGYVSDVITYRRNPQIVQSGVLTMSVVPELNGTSQPITFSIEAVKDSTGKETDALTKDVDLNVWTQAYNYQTDTTLALVMAKRTVAKMPIATLNKRSGQFSFTEASSMLPANSKYSFDVKMQNIAGEKIFKDVFTCQLQTVLYEVFRMQDNTVVDDASLRFDSYIANPTYTVQHIDRTPTTNNPNTITFIITDKYGNPFNPKAGEIIKRGGRQSFSDFANFGPAVYSETSMTFTYPFTPFPLGTNFMGSYDCFYRIPGRYIDVDGVDASTGEDRAPKSRNVNPIFAFRFYLSGDWIVTLKLPDVTRLTN